MAATRLTPLAVQIEAIGVEKVRSALRLVSNEAEGAQRRVGSASEHGTRGMGAWAALHSQAAGHVGEHSIAVGRLERALAGIVGHFLGANAAVEILGSGLLKFAIGSLETAGILGGLAILAVAYEKITEATRKAREEQDKLVKSLRDANDAARKGPESKLNKEFRAEQTNYNTLTGRRDLLQTYGARDDDKRIIELNKKIAESWKNLEEFAAREGSAHPLKTVDVHAGDPEAELSKRITLLSKGLVFEDQRKRVTAELRELEKLLTREVKSGTLSLEERTKALVHLSDVQKALGEKFNVPGKITDPSQLIGMTGTGETPVARAHEAYGQPMALLKAVPDNLIKQSQELMIEHVKPMLDAVTGMAQIIRAGIATTIGSAVQSGFEAAFSGKGLSGIFKAFGKSLLSSIGNIFGQLGQVWLTYGIMMTSLGAALWNPFTSGPAAIAIGAALMALSGALGATAHGSVGGGGYATMPRPDQITNVKLTSVSVADQARYDGGRVINNFTVIGTNDPKAQRELAAMVDAGSRRSG